MGEDIWVSGSLLPRLDNLEHRKNILKHLRCVFMYECVISVCAVCYLCAVCVLCICAVCVSVLYVFSVCAVCKCVLCVLCMLSVCVCVCAVCVVCCMCVPMPLLLEDKRQICEVILFPSLLVSNVSHRLPGWLGKCLCQMSNLANFVF